MKVYVSIVTNEKCELNDTVARFKMGPKRKNEDTGLLCEINPSTIDKTKNRLAVENIVDFADSILYTISNNIDDIESIEFIHGLDIIGKKILKNVNKQYNLPIINIEINNDVENEIINNIIELSTNPKNDIDELTDIDNNSIDYGFITQNNPIVKKNEYDEEEYDEEEYYYDDDEDDEYEDYGYDDDNEEDEDLPRDLISFLDNLDDIDDYDDCDYDDYDDRDRYHYRDETSKIKRSKVINDKKLKKTIKRHDVIVYKGKKGKNIRDRDEKVFKYVLKKLYPGDQKYMRKFRKHLLERIMRNAMISQKDFDKLVNKSQQTKRATSKRSSSKNKPNNAKVKGYNLTYSPFYDVSK